MDIVYHMDIEGVGYGLLLQKKKREKSEAVAGYGKKLLIIDSVFYMHEKRKEKRIR